MLENTEGAIKKGQPRETGNIGYTETGQINVRTKGQSKKQSRETGNIEYTRHRTNKC